MATPGVRFGFTSFSEALRWAHGRGVSLPAEFYSTLPAAMRKQAFTVSGLTRTEQVQAVLDSLNVAVMKGQTFAQWKETAPADLGALPKGRRQLIFRNFVQTNYGAGRAAQHERQKGRKPFLMYDAINDSRTRPAHAAMDGHIAGQDDPIWLIWTPPCGHNCRCTLIALTEAQAKARGLGKPAPTVDRNGQPVAPDPGWGSKPSTEQIDRMLSREVAQAKIAAPQKIDQAIDRAVQAAEAAAAPGELPIRIFGQVTPAFVEKMTAAVQQVPAAIRDTMARAGIEVYVARHIYDAMPELKGLRARGWGGAGFAGVGGVFNPRRRAVLTAETVKRGRKFVEESDDRRRGTMLHEMGHGWDAALGKASRSPEFRAAYDADAREIRRAGGNVRAQNRYFLQQGDAGPSEAWAEVFAWIIGRGGASFDVSQNWPRVKAFLKQLIEANT